ncbi:MAG TPA: T9SS type A sorting domain-containing protein [Ignavibacteria bacterium]|nr:T9SS type A sorting domain-containing protein [Ignavibacteria bacterium]
MKKLITALFIITGFMTSGLLYSQNVSTLVPGASTFDDGLSIDNSGNIYASRYVGTTITKITPFGQTSIFASGISTPNGTDFGPDGYLYVPSNVSNGKVVKISPAGVVEPFIASIPFPATVLFRSDGKMYISSYQGGKIFLADSAGNYSLLYTGGGMTDPVGLTLDDNENLYAANFNDGKIFSITQSGDITLLAQVPGIVGFIEYSKGYIYATGFNTHKIYKVTLTGQISVLAGTGVSGQVNGSFATATFNGPNGIVASLGGDSLFISDFNARSLRVISGISTGIINISSVTPEAYHLSQNYPNPFNPVTKIAFEITGSNNSGNVQLVRLSVFDAVGKEIANPVNENLSPGKYEADFDAGNLPSGVYFYRLEVSGTNQFTSGKFSQTKSMILLK